MTLSELEWLEADIAEESLADFIRLGWPNIDPARFVSNWHIDAIAEHLEAVTNGECRRLIINVPPRHMKSLSVSVAWPAWTWAQKRGSPLAGPQVGFLSLSYAQHLSVRDSVKCRRLIDSAWYQARWGDRFRMTTDQNTKSRYENDKGGYRIASSVSGTATGDGGDIVIIDDPISADDALSETVRTSTNDWFDNTITTRLNDPKTGAFVIIMQRLHEDDLVGHVLRRATEGEWTHLCLPARYEPKHFAVWPRDPRTTDGELLWPARMGEKEVSALERAMGSYRAAGQLQQRPAPREGGLFKREWFKTIGALPADVARTVRAWDLAATEKLDGNRPDWTAGVRMSRTRSGLYIIEGVRRLQGTPMAVERMILNCARIDGPRVTVRYPQDPGQAGKSQAQNFAKMLAGFPIKYLPPTGDKQTRAAPLAAQVEAGNVYLLVTGDPTRDAWIEPFLDELAVFPAGRHDDQVDAAADAFNELALGQPGYNPDAW